MKHHGSRSGLTVLELLVSVTLLAIVMTGVVDATDRGLELFRESSIKGDVNARAGRAAQRIVKEMLAVDGDTLVPDLLPPPVGPDPGNATIDFRTADSWAAGVLNWGPPTRIVWESEVDDPRNDLDDDGDGVVDEGMVVLVRDVGPNETRVVLASGVREHLEGELPNGLDDNGNGLVDEQGLCFTREGDAVVLRLSLERPDPTTGATVIRTQETCIQLRN